MLGYPIFLAGRKRVFTKHREHPVTFEVVTFSDSEKKNDNKFYALFDYDWPTIEGVNLTLDANDTVREFQKNNALKNQMERGRIRTNHFSKPDNRSNRFSNSSMAF